MLLPHFHPGRRNFPYLLGKIDLTPFPIRNSTVLSPVSINNFVASRVTILPRQFSSLYKTLVVQEEAGKGNVFAYSFHCYNQIRSWIVSCPTCNNGIPKHFTTSLANFISQLAGSSAFDTLKNCEKFKRFDFTNGSVSNVGKHIIFECSVDIISVAGRPA